MTVTTYAVAAPVTTTAVAVAYRNFVTDHYAIGRRTGGKRNSREGGDEYE